MLKPYSCGIESIMAESKSDVNHTESAKYAVFVDFNNEMGHFRYKNLSRIGHFRYFLAVFETNSALLGAK